ncbi:hypothetical protein P7K49_030974 [Saguinus oedipus]|uniref:Uncharacterized protein n=1 Tax=Saguinus oedipus TaxID=9490 RepID=A0ABQ9U4K1_SAGOE|nr:hypothetical protein P7K49_030974 [Saguinus oedipus]
MRPRRRRRSSSRASEELLGPGDARRAQRPGGDSTRAPRTWPGLRLGTSPAFHGPGDFGDFGACGGGRDDYSRISLSLPLTNQNAEGGGARTRAEVWRTLPLPPTLHTRTNPQGCCSPRPRPRPRPRPQLPPRPRHRPAQANRAARQPTA